MQVKEYLLEEALKGDKAAFAKYITEARRHNEPEKVQRAFSRFADFLHKEADGQVSVLKHFENDLERQEKYLNSIPEENLYVCEQDGEYVLNSYSGLLYQLFKHGRLEGEIEWCKTSNDVYTWSEYAKILRQEPLKQGRTYRKRDPGWKVVGKTWWFERTWPPTQRWQFLCVPERPVKKEPVKLDIFSLDDDETKNPVP